MEYYSKLCICVFMYKRYLVYCQNFWGYVYYIVYYYILKILFYYLKEFYYWFGMLVFVLLIYSFVC